MFTKLHLCKGLEQVENLFYNINLSLLTYGA